MANDNQFPSYPLSLKAPLGFSNFRRAGEIEILFNENKKDIYHRFSPYTDNGSLLGYGKKQPLVWRYPDEENAGTGRNLSKWIRNLEKLGVSPTVSGADDVERIGEWLTSGYGVQYTIKQGILQSFQPFNETSIYNPLSPFIASIVPISFGLLDRPTRFIDQGSLFGGLLSIFGLKGFAGGTVDALLGRALGRSPYTTIAPGSVGSGGFFGFRFGSTTNQTNPLPSSALDGGKGLMRGRTANKAESVFLGKWGSTGQSISSFIKQAIDPLIPNVLPRKINATYRIDEGSYSIMSNDSRGLLSYTNNSGVPVRITQMWYATPNAVSSHVVPISTLEFKRDEYKSFVIGKTIDGKPTGYSLTGGISVGDLFGGKIGGVLSGIIGGITSTVSSLISSFGIPLPLSGPAVKGQRRYSDSVGLTQDPYNTKNSDMLVRHADYIDSDRYESKFSRKTSTPVVVQQENLKRVLRSIEQSGIYDTEIPDDSIIFSSGNPSVSGYKALANRTLLFQNRVNGTSQEYYNNPLSTVIDHGINNSVKTLRMASSKYPDGINQLGILPKSRNIQDGKEPYVSWTKWDPYRDDLVAFFFYDVVNEKYIPFRATVKGINESSQAMWEELKFLGRADMLYSYSGFQRSLNFSFIVVINSITELLPTWKRVNYMAGCIKPSNYVKVGDPVYNRFMVPPMFMLTIGDLYRFQPIIITNITTTIPDDAVWETLNEENSPSGWKYLNGMIKAKNLGKKYAQLPREVEINIVCNVLEKERAVVGAANFGHAPHTVDYDKDVFLIGTENQPFLPPITEFSREMVEYQEVVSLDSPARTLSGPGVGESYVPSKNIPQPTTQGNKFNLISKQPAFNPGPMPVSNVNTNNVAPIFPKP